MGGHGAAMTPREEPLLGGNVTAGLVRVGDTVRRPAGPMAHPDATDLGIRPPTLTAIGRLARDLHDALDGWVPPADAVWHVAIEPDTEDLVVHHDLAPWNLVLAEDRIVLIDWDGCGPGSRTWDLAYAAHGFVPLAPPAAGGPGVLAAGVALRELADGYGLDDDGRVHLADLLARRTWSMHDLLDQGHRTGHQPWARMWDGGHGSVWRRDAEWIEEHGVVLRAALTR